MDIKEKVKLLVQQAVEAYLKEQVQQNENRSIAILLGYHSLYPSAVLEAVSSLFAAYDVTLLFSKEWLPIPSELNGKAFILLEETPQQELKVIVEKTSLLVVPVASYRLLAKLALTMDDEVAVWMAIQYQLEGKPIVIANDHIELNVNQQIHAPHSVQARLQSYIRQIQADKAIWIPLSKLANTVDEQFQDYQEKKPLILSKHIETAHREGLKEIFVSMKSQVTPAAMDLAKELKIHINKESPKGG